MATNCDPNLSPHSTVNDINMLQEDELDSPVHLSTELCSQTQSSLNTTDPASSARKRRVRFNLEPDFKKLKLNFAIGSDVEGVILTFGMGDVGQLGLGEAILERKKPALVKGCLEGVGIRQVACGGMHTVVLSDAGEVYSFGCNDEGALGRETEEGEETRPSKIQFPNAAKVELLSAGDSHTAYLTEAGSVFISGTFRDNGGLFGLQDKLERTKIPLLIYDGVKLPAIKIASGTDHLIILTNKGTILSLGNAEQGQLGRVASSFSSRGGRRGKSFLLEPKQVYFPKERGIPSVYISDVFCGAYHTYALAVNSRNPEQPHIYCWGLNNYGQLGLDHTDTMYTPTRMNFAKLYKNNTLQDPLEISSDVQICGGQHHTLMCSKGRVYVCGRGHFGALGLGKENNSEVATLRLIKNLAPISRISAGSSVAYAITSSGIGYAWGMGTCLQLTTGNEDDQFDPIELTGKQLEDRVIADISSGGQHTVILAQNKPDTT